MKSRNRNSLEKIEDALDKVGNLHPTLYERFKNELLSRYDLNTNVVKCIGFIKGELKTPVNGKNTKKYWIARGWSEIESNYKMKEFNKTLVKRPSPFSQEFWIAKINPNSGIHYTKEEADFERDSIRPIRKEYWLAKGFSEEESEIKVLSSKNPNNHMTGNKCSEEHRRASSKRCKEYWILRGFSEEEAKEKVSERQRTFALDICIEKYGEEDGLQRWLDRQAKWHKNFKKSNFSKISQKLFWDIAKQLDSLDDIFFAQLNKNKQLDESGKNNELKLKLSKVILPDFIDISQKKIIEYDGTYWHGRVGRGNKQREIDRNLMMFEWGYNVLHVNEQDYINDSLGTIEKCLNFLN